MGTARAFVPGAGSCPAWTCRVSKRGPFCRLAHRSFSSRPSPGASDQGRDRCGHQKTRPAAPLRVSVRRWRQAVVSRLASAHAHPHVRAHAHRHSSASARLSRIDMANTLERAWSSCVNGSTAPSPRLGVSRVRAAPVRKSRRAASRAAASSYSGPLTRASRALGDRHHARHRVHSAGSPVARSITRPSATAVAASARDRPARAFEKASNRALVHRRAGASPGAGSGPRCGSARW